MRTILLRIWRVVLCFGTVAFGQQMSVDFDPASTKIAWSLAGNVHTTHGTFQLKSGHVELNQPNDSVNGDLVVMADSGESGDGLRDKRMKKEILEVEKYPEIRFKVTKVEGMETLKDEGTVRVLGQFTIHGASHEVNIPMQIKINGTEINGTGKFVVPFVEWGMKDPSNFLFKVAKTVQVELTATGHVKR